MLIAANYSIYIRFGSGLGLYFQTRDDGGCEYDLIDNQNNVMDGGILDDTDVSKGIEVNDDLLEYIMAPLAVREDCYGIVFIRTDNEADARRWEDAA